MDIKTVNEIIGILEGYRDSGLRIDSERVSAVPLSGPSKRGLVLAVGHSRAGDKGALSWDDLITEWDYNQSLAQFIKRYLDESIDVTIINQYQGSSYAAAITNLKREVDPLNPELVVELHFNSFSNPQANGYEALYWHNSKQGKSAAFSFMSAMEDSFPRRNNRGAKAILTSSQRGARFLRSLKAPCVILEPFFGSNEQEWQLFKTTQGKQLLAKTIATGINECFSHRPK